MRTAAIVRESTRLRSARGIETLTCSPTRTLLALALAVPVALLPAVARAKPDPRQTARQIDQQLGRELKALDSPSERASTVDDETFLRRVYLDLIGRSPKPEEVIAFALDPASEKRERVVQRLLTDESFGENWGEYWRDVIFYRRSEERSLLAAAPTKGFLAEQLNANASWDKIVRQFILAEGDVREDGATGLIMAQGGRPEETVAEISRIFMGIQIQCAQCHDHPTDRWQREQFHELAAFFPRVAVRPRRDGNNRSFVVTATDVPMYRRMVNNNNRYRGTPEHRMPDLDDPAAQGELMQPVFFIGDKRLQNGAKDAVRRGKLADWLTADENPWFARAYVNRIWSELVGEGFYEPVDDLGPDRECSTPETLELIAAAFVESGYDVKWLFTTILATDTYQMQTRPRRAPDDSPFQANCTQRLRGSQLYKNLTTALEMPRPAATRRGAYGVAFGPETFFNQTFGFDPSQRREEVSGSIPQALLLMNSQLVNQAIRADRPTGLGRLLRRIDDNEDLVVELYLRTLARQPTESELKTSLKYLAEVDDRNEAFEDLLWALVNSTEFLHRR